jgi:hypothetical protein
MTARSFSCDTLSNSTKLQGNHQRDIMSIMGRWAAPGCRWVYFAERDGERLTATRRAEIEDDRTDREDRARQRLPLSSYPGFAEADRRAADLIGRILRRSLGRAS